MIRAGKSFCATCLETTQHMIYKVGSIYIEIQKNILGNYFVVPCRGEYEDAVVLNHPKPIELNGLPLELFVKIRMKGGKEETYLCNATNRKCEHCLRKGLDTTLPFFSGYLNQLIISQCGYTSCGKTAMVNALSHISNLQGNTRICPADAICYGSRKLQSTRLSDRTTIKEFLVCEEKTNQPLIDLLLCDTPGEILEASGAIRQSDDYRYFYQLLSIADGINLFLDERNTTRRLGTTPEGKTQNVDMLLRLLIGSFQDKPLAVILTKSDRLQALLQKPYVIVENNNRIPLNGSYEGFEQISTEDSNRLKAHMRANKAVIRDLVPLVRNTISEHRNRTGYFLISSGIPFDASDADRLDFSKARNIHLPVVWMLKQIFI